MDTIEEQKVQPEAVYFLRLILRHGQMSLVSKILGRLRAAPGLATQPVAVDQIVQYAAGDPKEVANIPVAGGPSHLPHFS